VCRTALTVEIDIHLISLHSPSVDYTKMGKTTTASVLGNTIVLLTTIKRSPSLASMPILRYSHGRTRDLSRHSTPNPESDGDPALSEKLGLSTISCIVHRPSIMLVAVTRWNATQMRDRR